MRWLTVLTNVIFVSGSSACVRSLLDDTTAFLAGCFSKQCVRQQLMTVIRSLMSANLFHLCLINHSCFLSLNAKIGFETKMNTIVYFKMFCFLFKKNSIFMCLYCAGASLLMFSLLASFFFVLLGSGLCLCFKLKRQTSELWTSVWPESKWAHW